MNILPSEIIRIITELLEDPYDRVINFDENAGNGDLDFSVLDPGFFTRLANKGELHTTAGGPKAVLMGLVVGGWGDKATDDNISKLDIITIKSLRVATLSIGNRLASIQADSRFVEAVAAHYGGLPLIANERCGSWYIPPWHKAGSVYFKSTDGHHGQWAFSLRRLNLSLLGQGVVDIAAILEKKQQDCRILITCDSGKDLSVGVAVVLLCLYYAHDAKVSSRPVSVDKHLPGDPAGC
ncbi:hypothetical protein DV735_g3652, partial [Chaetothyriales sp. CBS 134920]